MRPHLGRRGRQVGMKAREPARAVLRPILFQRAEGEIEKLRPRREAIVDQRQQQRTPGQVGVVVVFVAGGERCLGRALDVKHTQQRGPQLGVGGEQGVQPFASAQGHRQADELQGVGVGVDGPEQAGAHHRRDRRGPGLRVPHRVVDAVPLQAARFEFAAQGDQQGQVGHAGIGQVLGRATQDDGSLQGLAPVRRGRGQCHDVVALPLAFGRRHGAQQGQRHRGIAGPQGGAKGVS
jgi:hypothetical protein